MNRKPRKYNIRLFTPEVCKIIHDELQKKQSGSKIALKVNIPLKVMNMHIFKNGGVFAYNLDEAIKHYEKNSKLFAFRGQALIDEIKILIHEGATISEITKKYTICARLLKRELSKSPEIMPILKANGNRRISEAAKKLAGSKRTLYSCASLKKEIDLLKMQVQSLTNYIKKQQGIT